MQKNPIAQAIASVLVAPGVSVENLVMFPLLSFAPDRSSATPPYQTLDEALDAGDTEITEVSAHGSVPDLQVVNRGLKPTLIVDGEELLGARQNRVVNLTILVAAQSRLTIPVSCVEAGRWRAQSSRFSAAPRTQYAAGRMMRMAQVSRCMADFGERMSDQSAVWADIAQKSARMQAVSPTSAMEQIYTDHAASIETYVAGCEPVEGQVGAAFAIGDRIVGFDLFDKADTFQKLLPKLVRSYAVDAIDVAGVSLQPKADRRAAASRSADRPPITHLVPGFLGAVATASQRRTPALGMGADVRLAGNGLVGAALVLGGDVVHLSGFTA
jgi:hypothetical protein